jgi:hypothetical protein
MKRAATEKGIAKRRLKRRLQDIFLPNEQHVPPWAFELKHEAGRYRKKRPLGCPIGCLMCTGDKRQKRGGNSLKAKTRQEIKADGAA